MFWHVGVLLAISNMGGYVIRVNIALACGQVYANKGNEQEYVSHTYL